MLILRVLPLIFLCLSPIPIPGPIAGEEDHEVSQQLLSIYLRAYSFVLSRIESSNISLQTNLSVPHLCCLDVNLSKTMTIGELLNLSYSIALQGNLSIGEGNYSEASFLIKKALNLLRFVLKEVHRIQASSNQTAIPVGSMTALQIAFERHKRLALRLNLSVQKLQNLSEINATLINQMLLNLSKILEEGAIVAMYNSTREASKMLSEANKIMAEIKREIVRSSQLIRAEKMLNKTISKLNLSSVPENISARISNLTEEFNKVKAQGDVRKVKEVLR
ncbi:MAG TPA: hypothetical protein ENG61_02015, partial [Candidatus Korarchaeota archaeon]|nr:hypothetical protein [Candidatus Korarchaeota archaeon]